MTLQNSKAQFFDDFSDGNFTENPSWFGNITDFIVNELFELQLDAQNVETKLLYTNIALSDSITWDISFRLEFNPSDNNKMRIYLALDQLDLSLASGYFLELGENGSEDVLRFYKLINGEEEELAFAFGNLAEAPAYAQLKIHYFSDGSWEFWISYESDQPLLYDFGLQEPILNKDIFQYFLVQCDFSASRSDKFFFDNIGVKEYEPDITGPIFLSAEVIDPLTIRAIANEELLPESATNKDNYRLGNFDGNVTEVILSQNNTTVTLTLSEPLESGKKYSFITEFIQDIFLNPSQEQVFKVFVIDQPEQIDLVVNEILFNPDTDGSDYVEIYNRVNKFFDLSTIAIENSIKEELEIINTSKIIEPYSYLCITPDVEQVISRYAPPEEALFLASSLPGFNNDTGNVSLIYLPTGNIIDAFNYSESLHFTGLNDVNGISLERLDIDGNSQDRDNWFSASSNTNFGTPGYKNSVFIDPQFSDTVLDFEKKIFSPNGDGVDDQLIIKYNFPQGEYLVDIDIYDQAGRHVLKLVNNELFSSQGFVIWDGLNADNDYARIGIYIIVLEATDQDGIVIGSKKTAILADYLD